MAIVDDATLKTYFQAGDKPTEQEFASLIDSKAHTNDPRFSDPRTPTAHNHDDLYYTETEVGTLLSAKADLSGGKVPIAQIPDALLGQVVYKGVYDAATNTPALPVAAEANKGHYYVTSAAGTQQGLALDVGDWVISNGTGYDKVDNTDAVTTVFGRLGPITAEAGDYAAFYEPLIATKQTAFNKAFGTAADTVAEGNHNHDAIYQKLVTDEDVSASKTLAATDHLKTFYTLAAATYTLPASGLPKGWKVIIYRATAAAVSITSTAAINGAAGSRTITSQWEAVVVENYGNATTSQFIIPGY